MASRTRSSGFVSSLPWNRGETTVDLSTTVTKLAGNHTIKVGGTYRHNEDYLLQTQDQGGPRGFFTYNASITGSPANAASQSNINNAIAAFLLDRPSTGGRDLAVIDKPGTTHSAVFLFVHDKWQVSPKLTVDLGLRHEYYTPLVGIQQQGGLSNYDPSNNTLRVSGYGDVDNAIGVKSYWKQLQPASRPVLALRRQDRGARRLRNEYDSLRRQHVRVQLPGQAEQPVHRGQRLRPAVGREHGGGLPGAGRGCHPEQRHHRRRCRPAPAQRLLRLLPLGSEGRADPLVERRVPARNRLQLHRRSGLRRQPWPGHHPAPRPERRLRPRRRQPRAPAVRVHRPDRLDDRVPAVPHGLPLDAGEGRSPVPEQLPGDQLVYARQGREL